MLVWQTPNLSYSLYQARLDLYLYCQTLPNYMSNDFTHNQTYFTTPPIFHPGFNHQSLSIYSLIHLLSPQRGRGAGGICILTPNIFVLFRLPRLPFLQSTFCMQIANALLILILKYSRDPNSRPFKFEYQTPSTFYFTYYIPSGL